MEEKIRNLLRDSDYKKSESVMCALLMDPEYKTYKMFEGLALKYIQGSEEFRNGMDAALTEITGYDFNEIVKMIEEKGQDNSHEHCWKDSRCFQKYSF